MYKTILFGWKSDNKKVKFYDRTANSSQFKRNNNSDNKLVSSFIVHGSQQNTLNDTHKSRTSVKGSLSKATPVSSRVDYCTHFGNEERKPGLIGSRKSSERLNFSGYKKGNFSKSIDVGYESTEFSRDNIRGRISSASSQLYNIEKTNAAILNHLKEGNSLEVRELQNQLARKHDELERLKSELTIVKRRLTEEIYFTAKGNYRYSEYQQHQEKRIMEMTYAVDRLTNYLEKSKKNRQSEIIKDIELSKIVYPIYPSLHTDDILKMQKQNAYYECLVCDLHLENNFYKSQLEKHGISKTTAYKEAYRKLLGAQARRKRL